MNALPSNSAMCLTENTSATALERGALGALWAGPVALRQDSSHVLEEETESELGKLATATQSAGQTGIGKPRSAWPEASRPRNLNCSRARHGATGRGRASAGSPGYPWAVSSAGPQNHSNARATRRPQQGQGKRTS